MRRSIAFLAVLVTAMFLLAMSDAPKEDPKSDNGFITQEELHNIAVNYYKYYFEEEHEWKGIKVASEESVIRSITPVIDGDLTLAYLVDYNPDGLIVLNANKTLGALINSVGSGSWSINPNEKFIRVDDKRIDFITQDWLKRIKKAFEAGENLTKDKQKNTWEEFLVPINSFNKKADFDKRIPQPDWWIEKKKSKNTQGMIQSEWYQN